MQREQFTFYRSFWEAVKRLRKAADRLSALEAIAAYALDGEETNRTDAADAVFVLIKPVLNSAAKKAKGGKNSASEAEDKDKISERQAQDTDKEKEGEKEKEKENECYIKRAPARRFAPPTLDEVKAYCQERGNKVDAERFIDFYTSNGWKVGKNPMKDWRAAVRTWEREDNAAPKRRGKMPMNETMHGSDPATDGAKLAQMQKMLKKMEGANG